MLKFMICISALATSLSANAAGSLVSVAKDGETLIIKREPDGKIEKFNVIERCGRPAIGEPKIRAFHIADAQVQITFGKHCTAVLALTTSELSCRGCD